MQPSARHIPGLGWKQVRERFRTPVNKDTILTEIETDISKYCKEYLELEAGLRHFVARYLSDERPRQAILGVISAYEGDGRTTIALGLAQALSELHSSVLMVELGTEGVGLFEDLGVKETPGLRDYLEGQAEQ